MDINTESNAVLKRTFLDFLDPDVRISFSLPCIVAFLIFCGFFFSFLRTFFSGVA
jgi:hypothetical protein